jgi:phage baseplate assembly protein W
MPSDLFGRGASFPLRIGARGGIRESAGVQKIEESIRIILGTQFGERVMRPDFGCNLRSLAFAPNNSTTAALARHYVLDGLTKWEPRINVLSVTVTNDSDDSNGPAESRLLIKISYAVQSSLQPQSMIYPFYLEQP